MSYLLYLKRNSLIYRRHRRHVRRFVCSGLVHHSMFVGYKSSIYNCLFGWAMHATDSCQRTVDYQLYFRRREYIFFLFFWLICRAFLVWTLKTKGRCFFETSSVWRSWKNWHFYWIGHVKWYLFLVWLIIREIYFNPIH